MHYTGSVYRPPLEANTVLLEVTSGCSWNKCSFCSMYHDTRFGVTSLDVIEADLKEVSMVSTQVERIFLVNGDAFTLGYEQLMKIAQMVHKYLPEIKTISCYASIRNIRTKSMEQLRKLHEVGFNDFYIGLETASDYGLELMNKGYTQKEEYENLEKLKLAGISYNAIIMYGVVGPELSKEHIKETAKLLNRFKPKVILSMSTSVQPNTALWDYRKEGKYVELTERELINEELDFIKSLNMDDECYYFGSHPYNLMSVSGYFENKDKIVKYIENKKEELDNTRPGLLDKVLSRGSL